MSVMSRVYAYLKLSADGGQFRDIAAGVGITTGNVRKALQILRRDGWAERRGAPKSAKWYACGGDAFPERRPRKDAKQAAKQPAKHPDQYKTDRFGTVHPVPNPPPDSLAAVCGLMPKWGQGDK